MLQRLWDKYVPASSPEYGKIELVYLKGGPEGMEKQPEQIQLLIHLILKNKMMQLNLMRRPVVVRLGQKQMESCLQRVERYYAVQLKSADLAMYRTVRQYMTLLEQVGEDDRRYQNWQKTNLAIEKQKDAYRLLSLFSEKIRERMTVHSISILRRMERDFVDSLTETEYQMLAEELIWQEKPELIASFNEWDEFQCGNILTELEKDSETNTDMRQILSQVSGESAKEKLITAVEKLGQREFCLFYHQIADLEAVRPQMILWKESRVKMLSAIDQMEPEALQQMQSQIHDLTNPLGQDTARMQENDSFDQNTLQTHPDWERLRTLERELVHSLSEAEYQTLSEKNIWQEKPELIAYLEQCEQAQCTEIVRELEKDVQMSQILSRYAALPVKERLVTAAGQLGQQEFCLFYHQITALEAFESKTVLWKESRTKMLHAIDLMDSAALQQLQGQIKDLMVSVEYDSPIQNITQIQEEESPDQEMLRTLERELVYSLSETEYQTLSEKNIWQEKPEFIAYLKQCEQAQCTEIVRELEKDVQMSKILSRYAEQPAKERLITAAGQLGQKEFTLFYHQVMKFEDIAPQIVLWKESRTEMLHFIDQMEFKALQQVWEQIERSEHQYESDTLREHEREVQRQELLRTQEKELLDSLLETEYQILAERLIWQEKPELIAYFRTCEKAQCKEIIRQLEQDFHMRQILLTIQKQSAKKKLIAMAYKLEQKEFGPFYWQVMELLKVHPQLVIWKKSRAEMIRSIDALSAAGLQQAWEQMQAVEPVQGLKQVFTEKMLSIQNQYQQDASENFQEQIADIVEESDLAGIADIIDLEQLMQEPAQRPADGMQKSRLGEREQLVLWDGAYQVIQNLEQERERRRESIEQQQMQAARAYQEVYRQISVDEERTARQQENMAQAAVQIFRRQHQEQLTGEEIRNIYEWSQAFMEVYLAQQGQAASDMEFPEESTFSPEQNKQSELLYVIRKMDQYFMEHATGEKLILRWQEELTKDERIQKLLIYIGELEEQKKEQFIRELADMVQLSVQLSFQGKANTIVQPDTTESAMLTMQRDQQESAKELLRPEDREFARSLLQLEDRELARRLLWSEDTEFAKRLLQTEDTEFVEGLLQIEDQEFARKLLQVEDRELAKRLLQVEDREFAKRLLQVEDSELVKSLLLIEDRELAWKLLRTQNGELVGKLLQDSDRQLLDVSYMRLWEWGETLLFHPEHEKEWEDDDILTLSFDINDTNDANEATKADVQTQLIRRQIEMAKDRNRLQSLIRQINHQTDLQLEYTDAQLRLPQVQTLLQYVQQLDEKQYGVLVKELAQITKLQKLSFEEPESVSAAVHTAEDDEFSGVEGKSTARLYNRTDYVEQSMQGDTYEFAGNQLRGNQLRNKELRKEDREFIEKLLQLEDSDFAERLLQVKDEELAKRLLQIEDRTFSEQLLRLENEQFAKELSQVADRELAWKLLRLEDRAFAEKLLRVGDKELTKKLLQVENKEFVERLLRVGDKELTKKLLQVENREFVERLLRIEDKEFVLKLLEDSDGQPQEDAHTETLYTEASYRNMWEWGEALLFYPAYQAEHKMAGSQQEAFSSDLDDAQQADNQAQVMHQRNHLQSLIGQINHQADVELVYTDAQLGMPQIQALLQYVRQLDVKQYGAFVKELARVVMVQKLSYDAPETSSATDTEELSLEQRTISEQTVMRPSTEVFSLEQGTVSYPKIVQLIEDYEKRRQAELYKDIRKIGQKIFPQAYRTRQRQYIDRNRAGGKEYGFMPYEEGGTEYILASNDMGFSKTDMNANGLALSETGMNVNGLAFSETDMNVNGLASSEASMNVNGLELSETGINAYSLMPYEDIILANDMPYESAEEEVQIAQRTLREGNHQENRYQPQELEYSVQKAPVSEEDQQRQGLRMQRETAQLKSVQEQLDKKLKEVEQQLKKVEDSTRAKEDVQTFAEQVKRQMYEELHVEKLRRGLI